MIKVKCYVPVRTVIDEKGTKNSNLDLKLVVSEADYDPSHVMLQAGKDSFEVNANDLIAAIENARNVNRYL